MDARTCKTYVMIVLVSLPGLGRADGATQQRAVDLLNALEIPMEVLRDTRERDPKIARYSGHQGWVSMRLDGEFRSVWAAARAATARNLRAAEPAYGDREALVRKARRWFGRVGISMEGYLVESYHEVDEDDRSAEEKGVVHIIFGPMYQGYPALDTRAITMFRSSAKPIRMLAYTGWTYDPPRVNVTPEQAAMKMRQLTIATGTSDPVDDVAEIQRNLVLRYVPTGRGPNPVRHGRLAYDCRRGNVHLIRIDAETGEVLMHGVPENGSTSTPSARAPESEEVAAASTPANAEDGWHMTLWIAGTAGLVTLGAAGMFVARRRAVPSSRV